MSEIFLDRIITLKLERVEQLKRETNIDALKKQAIDVRNRSENHRLRTALSRSDRTNIVAEIKRASPSKGVINDHIDIVEIAQNYENSGAIAISVLTEEDFFKGSLDDLVTVRNAVDLPILRKDFVVDEVQIYESAAAGADAILLIVAILTAEDLRDLLRLGRDTLGMDVIVEVHTAVELDIAANVGADIIGVNNRDLRTFDVSLDVSRQLIQNKPPNALMIAESGLSTREEIDELKVLGFDGFLIGEMLMKSGDVKSSLRWLAGN